MSSNKEAQAARNAADRRLREAYPDDFEDFMHDEHEKRGITWNRRATPEERARREAAEKEAKARARIEAEAKKAGIVVAFPTVKEQMLQHLNSKRPEDETIAEKVARIGNEAEEAERANAEDEADREGEYGHEVAVTREPVVDSGSYADDIVNERSAPMGGWR